MAKEKTRIAIVRVQNSPADYLADTIAATAAVYAIEHYEEFSQWLKKEMEEKETEYQAISKLTLDAAIARIIMRSPETI